VKRAVMEALGFETIDATGDTVREAVRLTGTGVDAAVEASGLPQTLLQSLEATAPRGQVLILGDLKGDVTMPRALVSSLIRRELTVLGTWNSKITPGGHSEWDMVVSSIASGRLQVAPLISHALPLAEAGRAFAEMIERRVWSNKVLFAVSAQALAEAADPAVAPAAAGHALQSAGAP
jgi:L-iditol 2-dehydrogenase